MYLLSLPLTGDDYYGYYNSLEVVGVLEGARGGGVLPYFEYQKKKRIRRQQRGR